MYLGTRISDKVAVRFFQFHRDTKQWCWKEESSSLKFRVALRRPGTDASRVALLLSVSGTVRPQLFPAEIDESYFLYEVAPVGCDPNLHLLSSYEDLLAFRRTYLGALSRFERDHPLAKRIHLFPAIPLSVSVLCGHDLLNKAHPAIEVYDNDKAHGGFAHRITLNRPQA
jgi:hypothetical protein